MANRASEKFNLNWPIYDGQKLNWYPSPGMQGRQERVVSRDLWHREPVVIVSSHLVRRADRQKELLEAADPWDLVILDEAHHARRRGAGSASEGSRSGMLRLMLGMKTRTQGLVLLTATPMQVHPVEVFDLLSLLGLPSEWGEQHLLRFFNEVLQDNPTTKRSTGWRACSERWNAPTARLRPPKYSGTVSTVLSAREAFCGRYAIVPTRPAANWRPPTGRSP